MKSLYAQTSKRGCVYQHVFIAECALGRPLPPGAQVHHVDENKRNNANANLVICQDRAYHKLLHVRARIVKAGGNPNTDKFCGDCQRLKSVGAFNLMRANKSTGRQSVCRDCSRVRDKAKHDRRRATEAA